ncbi:MAG: hypothetical protein HY815_17630, partial [Candidatus Riflebacteria bacterium]|nr:hypothetical protein [Candidatus Riflebacteria bacterium]
MLETQRVTVRKQWALATMVLGALILAPAVLAGGYPLPVDQNQQGGYYQQGGGYQQGGYYQQGGGYQQGGYYGKPGVDVRNDPAGKARLGRTLGGAAGIAAGSFGGALIASSVIKAAGVAALGPVAPILVGAAITAGGAFIGAKAFSLVGQGMDRTMGPGMTWTLMGGIAGSIAGFSLLPALGPFAGPMGRVIGAALGGFLGGMIGKVASPVLDRYATPPMIYGATGAILGGVGFGPLGAVAGAAGG